MPRPSEPEGPASPGPPASSPPNPSAPSSGLRSTMRPRRGPRT
jgi:hypothetical protein